MAGPAVPTSDAGIATPALSFSTSAVFCAIDRAGVVEVCAMMASIIATVRLFFTGFVALAVAITLGLSAYQSRLLPAAALSASALRRRR